METRNMLLHVEVQFWLATSSMFETCDVSCTVRGFLWTAVKGDSLSLILLFLL